MKVKVLRPCGHRYLIQLLENKEVTKKKGSGIVIPENTKYAAELEGKKRDICIAKVLQKGISTKIEADRKTHWAEVGDYVLVNRYSWFEVPGELDTDLPVMIVNDEDILAIVGVEE